MIVQKVIIRLYDDQNRAPGQKRRQMEVFCKPSSARNMTWNRLGELVMREVGDNFEEDDEADIIVSRLTSNRGTVQDSWLEVKDDATLEPIYWLSVTIEDHQVHCW